MALAAVVGIGASGLLAAPQAVASENPNGEVATHAEGPEFENANENSPFEMPEGSEYDGADNANHEAGEAAEGNHNEGNDSEGATHAEGPENENANENSPYEMPEGQEFDGADSANHEAGEAAEGNHSEGNDSTGDGADSTNHEAGESAEGNHSEGDGQ